MEKNELKELKKAMSLLQSGDIHSLETIYQLMRKGVFTFVLPIVHSYETAEDITQDTFVKIYEQISKFDKKKNPVNWILTISKNLALTKVVKDSKEIPTDFQEPINGNKVYVVEYKNFDTPFIDLANEILSPSEFQIVTMFAIAEYKHREIAEILNLPLGTVTWKYNNAIKKLKEAAEKKGLNNAR